MAKTSVYSIIALILPFVFFSCKDNEDIDGPGPAFAPISWSAVENSNPDGIDIEIFGGDVYIASEFQGGEITLEADEDVYIHQQNPKDFKWYRKTEYEDGVLSMSVQKDKVYIKLAAAAASSEAQIMIVGKYDTKVGKIVLKREFLERYHYDGTLRKFTTKAALMPMLRHTANRCCWHEVVLLAMK